MSTHTKISAKTIYTDVQERLQTKIGVTYQTAISKKKRLENLLYWAIGALIISIPLAILLDELIYLLRPGFFIYSLPEPGQWIWAAILVVVCFIGLFIARLGWFLYKRTIEKLF